MSPCLVFEKREKGIALQPTVSIGVSNLKTGDIMPSLFKRADDGLYMSKRTGRNKVSIVP